MQLSSTHFPKSFRKNLGRLVLGVTALIVVPATAAIIQGKVPVPRARPAALKGIHVANTTATTPSITPARIVSKRKRVILSSSNHSLSSSEMRILDKALKYAFKKNFAAALVLSGNLSDPAARKLIEWLYLLSPKLEVSHTRITKFIRDNPEWPRRARLQARVEQSLYKYHAHPDDILKHFRNRSPSTAEGKFAIARAYIAKGNKSQARKWVQDAWRNNKFGRGLESATLKEFNSLISRADHVARVQFYIYARKTKAANRNAARLGSSYVKMVRAAGAYLKRSARAARYYSAVPSSLKSDPSLLYARIRGLRRSKKITTARRLIARAPSGSSNRGNLKRWWTERRLLAREAIAAGSKREGYRLAANHGFPLNNKYVNNYVDAELMSGWIALRHLKDTSKALTHFKRVEKAADGPRSRSSSAYWLARTYRARGDKSTSKRYMRKAAAMPRTYYGQLALDSLGSSPSRISLGATPRSTTSQLKSYHAVRAMLYLHRLGHKITSHSFFSHMPYVLNQRGDLAALAALATQYRMPHVSLRIAKKSESVHGFYFGKLQFPTNVLPRLKRIGKPVELALIHALIRQESEFNGGARSHAGAQGLMQMMPGTARITAKRHRQPYSRKRLSTDPAYNLMLGTAHIGDLIDRFNGSYIMLTAAYNAGGGRVNEWNRKYGDPRKGQIDPIDWVESIPFNETRNYVKRVMENMHVYRSALNGGSKFTMTSDISRKRIHGKRAKTSRKRTKTKTPECVSASSKNDDDAC